MPTTPTENPASYLIELDAFNITKDWVPQKPYTTEDYATAKNNVDGINAALDYATNTLNASIVKLPKGTYTFTFLNRPMGSQHSLENRTCILVPSDITIDLTGCVIETMYDSINRSPYDNSTDPVYKFCGSAFGFFRCINSKIVGGEIKGDVYQRSFISGEASETNSYGIMHNFGSRFCSVEGTIIRGFMADGIYIGIMPESFSFDSTWNPQFSKGNLLDDGTDNLEYVSADLNNSYKTAMITLPGAASDKRNVSILTGVDNTRVPGFQNGYSVFYWYNESQQFIAKETNQILTETKRPENAKYLRVVTHNQASNLDSLYLGIQVANNACTNFTVTDCDISDNHRGGICGGASNTLIQSCRLYNNGLGWKENKPTGTQLMGYQINASDNYCLSVTVNNCDIGDGWTGILAGVHNVTISNCRLYNLQVGIAAYDGNKFNIFNNKFNNMLWAVTLEPSASVAKRKLILSDNYIRNADNIACGYEVTLINNYIEKGLLHFDNASNMKKNTFLNCIFDWANFGPEVSDNIFAATVRTRTYFQSASSTIRNNTFRNYTLQCLYGDRSVITFSGCTFDNTAIAYTGSSSIAELNYINCIFKNGTYHFNGFYGSPPNGAYPRVLFEGSIVYLSNDRGSDNYDAQYSPVGLVGTYNNNPSMFTNEIILKNSTIYLTGDDTATAFGSSFGYGYTSITLENVTVKKEPTNTATPTFRWYNAIVDNAVTVRNGMHIGEGITYNGIADAKFKKNTIAPERLPKYIGEEYIWFDAAEGVTNILKGINTNNLNTAWAKVN